VFNRCFKIYGQALIQTKAAVLQVLARFKDSNNLPVFYAALKSESYTVQAAALFGISQLDEEKARQAARAFENDNAGELTEAIFYLYGKNGDLKDWLYIYKRYTDGTLQEKIHLLAKFTTMIVNINNSAVTQQGIAVLTDMGIKYKADGAASYIIKFLDQIKEAKKKQNDNASVNEAVNGVNRINQAK